MILDGVKRLGAIRQASLAAGPHVDRGDPGAGRRTLATLRAFPQSGRHARHVSAPTCSALKWPNWDLSHPTTRRCLSDLELRWISAATSSCWCSTRSTWTPRSDADRPADGRPTTRRSSGSTRQATSTKRSGSVEHGPPGDGDARRSPTRRPPRCTTVVWTDAAGGSRRSREPLLAADPLVVTDPARRRAGRTQRRSDQSRRRSPALSAPGPRSTRPPLPWRHRCSSSWPPTAGVHIYDQDPTHLVFANRHYLTVAANDEGGHGHTCDCRTRQP